MTARKAGPKKAAPRVVNYGYYKNKEGRVFKGSREIVKAARTGKGGLIQIDKSIFDVAIKANGMTAPTIDEEENEDGEGE
jgi:hypothetical protein